MACVYSPTIPDFAGRSCKIDLCAGVWKNIPEEQMGVANFDMWVRSHV